MKSIFNPMSGHCAEQLLPKFSRIVFIDDDLFATDRYHAEIKSKWVDDPTTKSAVAYVQIVSFNLAKFRANNPSMVGITTRTRVLISITQIVAINKVPRHAAPTAAERQ